jgi:chromosome condensin MukBEF complex kleisin-like MukF subunit
VRTPAGELCVKDMIRDDIAAAARRGDRARALALKLVIRDYIARHPRCEARHHPRPS